MSSREKILAQVLKNQPQAHTLPEVAVLPTLYPSLLGQFKSVIERIGGTPIEVGGWQVMHRYISEHFTGRIVNSVPGLDPFIDKTEINLDPHFLEDVQLAIIPGHFAVAENGAIWITEDQLIDRALPFIAERIAFVIDKKNIVATMHDAYQRIGNNAHEFGTFIAGPSKTADIEQSLVIGAHGPKSMLAFIY